MTDTAIAENLLQEASAHIQQQRLSKARKLCDQVLTIDPQSAPAHMLLASIAEQKNQTERAWKLYEKAVTYDPKSLISWVNFGAFLREVGQPYRAVEAFKRALSLDSSNLVVRTNLASALMQCQRMGEAIDHFNVALKHHSGWPEVHFWTGLAHQALGRNAEAEEHHRKALEVKPEFSENRVELAQCLCARGAFEEAETHVRQAIDETPGYGRAHHLLSVIAGNTDSAQTDLERIDQLLASKDVTQHGRLNLHFAAANFCERLERYDQAFDHCNRANALVQAEFGMRNEQVRAEFDHAASLLDGRDLKTRSEASSGATQPVFVVGMPRSGLTLVEQILSCHSQIAVGGEMIRIVDIDDTRADPNTVLERFHDRFHQLTDPELKKLATRYEERFPKSAQGSALITDRVSANHGRLALLAMIYPEAPIIHVRRNAMDVCWSTYFENLPEAWGYAADMTNIADAVLGHSALTDVWKEKLPNPSLDLAYEDLVSDPEAQIKKLIAFVGLDWEAACLDFPRSANPVSSPCYHAVRQEASTGAIGKWKNYETHLEPLRQALDGSAQAS